MILEIIPDSLYTLLNIQTLLSYKNSSILHKSLDESLLDKKMYLSTVVIIFVIKGKQVISNYDGQEMTIHEGQMIYLPKDIYLVSDFVTVEDGRFEALLFFMEDIFIEKFVLTSATHARQSGPEINNKQIFALQSSSQIKHYINALIQIYRNIDNSLILVELKLMELLQLIKLQEGGDDFLHLLSSMPPKREKRNIKSFMQDNYLKNLKVEDYAALTGRSLSSFIRDFKKLYNTTPHQWLIQQRLKKAHDLLTTTNLNVTETAIEVGYENISHFIKAYKKLFGHTPNAEKFKK